MSKDLGASADAETGSRASTEPSSTVSALTGFDPARIGDLPERLFAHSMELVGDDEEDDPSALFYEIQDAVRLLAEIRNELARTETCEVCDTPNQCASGATQCYLSGEFVGGAERTVAQKALAELGYDYAEIAQLGMGRQADGEPVPQVGPDQPPHAVEGATGDQSREGARPAEVSAEHPLSAQDCGAATAEVAPEHEGTILDHRVWNNPKLAYLYLLADRLAETFPEDSPQEDALRLAMSKIDEADMIIRRAASADTHPKDGDVKQAPLVSGAVGSEADETPR